MTETTTQTRQRFASIEPLMAKLAGSLLVATIFFMPISTAATNVTMVLCLLVWIVSGQWASRLQVLRENPVAWWVLALFALTCIGGLYSSGSPQEIGFQLHKHARLLFFIPALTLLQEPVWRQRCLHAFATAMLLTLILSLFSVITPLEVVKGTVGGATGNHFVFKDHIAQNLMMSFFVLLMLSTSQTASNSLTRRLSYLLALLAILDILFFVQGRTGYVSLGLNLVAFLLLLTHGRQRLFFIATLIGIGLLTINYSSAFKQRLELTIKEYSERDKKELTSVGQRIEFLDKSIQLIKESPLIGHGTGSYGKEFCRLAETPEWCEVGKAHPHNQFMSMGVQFGVVGILVYLALIGSIIGRSRHLSPSDRLLGIGIALTLITDSIFHAPLFLVAEAQFFTLIMAVTMAAKHQHDSGIQTGASAKLSPQTPTG